MNNIEIPDSIRILGKKVVEVVPVPEDVRNMAEGVTVLILPITIPFNEPTDEERAQINKYNNAIALAFAQGIMTERMRQKL